jgi:hypothetical protein
VTDKEGGNKENGKETEEGRMSERHGERMKGENV